MNPVFKDIFREIKKSAGRFVSITLLLILAVGFYSGLRATQPDMRLTADKYMDDCGMFDIRVQSALGMSETDLEAIRALDGVDDAEGAYAIDALVHAPDSDIIVSLQTLSERGINMPELLSGRLPERADECLVESRFLNRMGLALGGSVKIKSVPDAFSDALTVREFTVVGTVRSPLYISKVQRGVSTHGTGRISSFVIIPRGAVSLDYYTEINALVTGAKASAAYGSAYDGIVGPIIDAAKTLGETLAPLRRDELTADAREKLLDAERELADAEQQIRDGYAQLDAAERELASRAADSLAELEAVRAMLDADAYQQRLEYYDAEISNARQRLEAERRRLEDADITLQEGRAERELAYREIEDVPEGTWYVLGRSSNYGYSGFGQDADRMGALGAIFPIIFFAVAALVCLTTMTRMVDEQRVEIGTFKSLGLHRLTAAGKFIVYGGLAAVIGVTAGLSLGMTLLPRFIFRAYSVLYELPTLETPFHHETVSISVGASLICTLGATAIACAAALRETPAGLLRPRAPTPGRRVFLEHITPLWKRMSFFGKVSARNVLRYKKRLIMTITGIAGCTALIVTGLGLRDSIVDLPRMQFEELYKYDLLVTIGSGAGEADIRELRDTLDGSPLAADYGLVRSVSADFSAGAAGYAGEILIPEAPDELGPLITIRRPTNGPELRLSDDGVIISAKLAELLSLEVGDTMTLEAGGRYDVTVAAVAEQYVNHVVYMSPVYYERVFREEFRPNQVLIRCYDETEETANALSTKLLSLKAVGHAVYFKNETDGFTRSIGSINSVVTIIVLAAGALALVVLFNLTNINITERRRELATIKVLGFYDAEVTWYIIRENLFLTLVAIAVGLVAGKFLHNWLIRTVEVDFTMFKRSVAWSSYVFAALLTTAFAVIVNIAGHIRMKRINMVESLKINE